MSVLEVGGTVLMSGDLAISLGFGGIGLPALAGGATLLLILLAGLGFWGSFRRRRLEEAERQQAKERLSRLYQDTATQDLEARKQAEAALRECGARLRSLFDESPLASLEIDIDGRITRVNGAALSLLGYTNLELVGRFLSDLMLDHNLSRQNLAAKFSQNSPLEVREHTLWRKDGSLLPALFIEGLVRNAESRVTGLQILLQDMTERKQMEGELEQARREAREAARLKAEFMSNVGHEIRTPMNTVLGMTGLLLDTNLTNEQREYADAIRTSTDSLLQLVNNILDFSRMEKGELSFDVVDFNLRTVVEETIELFAGQAERKGLRLASVVYSDVPTVLRGDPGRLRQVLSNLLGNAIKFTEKGEVTLRVTKENRTGESRTGESRAGATWPADERSEKQSEDAEGAAARESEATSAEMIRFEISDTGIGIPEEAQQRLFRAFAQGDGSATRRYNGLGLGLAISTQLVQLMGGEIGVKSAPGEGSTFHFTVRPGKRPYGSAVRSDLRGLRVLVAGDNAADRNVLVQQVRSWEMMVSEAEDEQQLLDSLRRAAEWGEPFDLLLLDVSTRGMYGFDLARTIKADPLIASVCLVLVSSVDHWGNGRIVASTGIAAYLNKPITRSRLFETLLAVINDSPVPTPRRARGERPESAKSAAAGNRILIVEDNLTNQQVTLRQVQKLGYRADLAANGIEALEALERYPYALVLMDCQMPEMDGFLATAELRRREGATRRTPVIALTANALRGDRDKCFEAGMDDYLIKPVKMDDLSEILSYWLGGGEQAAEAGSETAASVPVAAHSGETV